MRSRRRSSSGLSGQTDARFFGSMRLGNDFVVVTANARDFVDLLDVGLHPGLIVLKSNLSRVEQWERLEIAIPDHVMNPDPEKFMINCVLEVLSLH